MKYPIISDVEVDPEGNFHVVTSDRGELTSLFPRCQNCRHAAVTEKSPIVRCRLGVSTYADIRRKRPIDPDTAATWGEPGTPAPYLREQDVQWGNQGQYVITIEDTSKVGPSTPKIRHLIEKACDSTPDVDSAIDKALAMIREHRALRQEDIHGIERIVRIAKGSEDIMDAGIRVDDPFLNVIDEADTTDIAKRKEYDSPRLFNPEVAEANYSPARAYLSKGKARVYDITIDRYVTMDVLEPREFADPGFTMPVDPGRIEACNRCYPNVNYVLCPIANGTIPFCLHKKKDADGEDVEWWGPDVTRIKAMVDDPRTDPEILNTIVLLYDYRAIDIIKRTNNDRVLDIIRRNYSGNDAVVMRRIKGGKFVDATIQPSNAGNSYIMDALHQKYEERRTRIIRALPMANWREEDTCLD